MAKQSHTKEKPQQTVDDQPRQRQEVATLQPARLPYHPIYQERYGVDGVMWRALVEAIYPSAKTVEGIILAVSYCKSKGYDVMKKMVHVVPIWNSALKKEIEGIWEAVSALRATAFRTGLYAGCDETKFGPIKVFHFDDEVGWGEKAKRVVVDVEMPEWAQITVYRLVNGVRCAFPGPRVFYIGAYGCRGKSEIPNEKWGVSGDSYMLEKCAEAAALRKAFPEELGGINTAEEMEGRRVDVTPGPTIDYEPAPPRPTRQSTKADAEVARKAEAERASQFRQTMAEESRPEPETVEHDHETGEVTEHAGQSTDGPDRTGPANSGTPSGNQTSEKEPDAPKSQPEKETPDYTKIAKTITDKIAKAGIRRTFDAILHDYADDMTALESEAPEMHAAAVKDIEAKRAWFNR